jgi:hypothetical protein
MGAGLRGFRLAVGSLGVCLVSAGCISSGYTSEMFDKNECTSAVGFCSIATPIPKCFRKLPPPAGFSSTYQQCLLDRARQARRSGQPGAQDAARKNPANIDAVSTVSGGLGPAK